MICFRVLHVQLVKKLVVNNCDRLLIVGYVFYFLFLMFSKMTSILCIHSLIPLRLSRSFFTKFSLFFSIITSQKEDIFVLHSALIVYILVKIHRSSYVTCYCLFLEIQIYISMSKNDYSCSIFHLPFAYMLLCFFSCR